MWWPFGKSETNENTEEVLKGLLKSQEMLNENFKNKRVTTEYYLKQSEEFRKKIDKCRKKLGEK